MGLLKDLKRLNKNMQSIKARFERHRNDINDNTSECSKLLYRLEEAELQIKNLQAKFERLGMGG